MSIASAWQTMRAGTLTHMGKFNIITYIVFFAIAVLKFSVFGIEELFIGFLCWSAIPGYVFWATIGSKSLKLLRDTDLFIIPNVNQAVVRSLLLQYGLSVILPAFFISLFTGHFALILVLFTLFALCGLLSTLINPVIGMGTGLLPYVFILLDTNKLMPDKNSNGFIIGLLIGAVVLALITVRQVKALRNTYEQYNPWSTPSFLAPVKGSGWDVYTLNISAYANKQSKSVAAHLNALISRNNTKSPELSLRLWLGKAFIPRPRVNTLVSILMTTAAFFGVPWLIMANLAVVGAASELNNIAGISLSLISIVFLSLVLIPKLLRLHRLYKNYNAELSELPLIPAWSDEKKLRTLILRILLKEIGVAFLISSAFSIATIFSIQPSIIGIYAFVLVLNGCSALIALGYGLRIISRQKRRSLVIGLAYYYLPLLGLAFLSISGSESVANFINPVNYSLWTLSIFASTLYLYLSLRNFKAHRNLFIHA